MARWGLANNLCSHFRAKEENKKRDGAGIRYYYNQSFILIERKVIDIELQVVVVVVFVQCQGQVIKDLFT